MIGFWIAAALVSAGAALLILLRAAGAGRAVARHPARAVYARQLDEIDDLAARGLIAEPERKAARAEASRRLIGAAEEEAAAPAETGRGRRMALAAAIVAPLLALGLYLATGSPHMADQPFAARLAGWRKADPATLDAPRFAALLEQVARERPTDPEPLIYLARAEMAEGDKALAVRNLERAARLAPRRAEVWAAIGEGLSDLSGGEMSPDARRAFAQSLKLDPRIQLSRYRLARADIAEGRTAQGLTAWRALLAELPPADPRRSALAAELAAVERTGRLPAPAAPAAPEVSGGEQRAFIQSMVDRLAARLKAQPDDPAGWARLIHAYGVLGQEDRRRAAVAEVEKIYASRPALMRSILAGR